MAGVRGSVARFLPVFTTPDILQQDSCKLQYDYQGMQDPHTDTQTVCICTAACAVRFEIRQCHSCHLLRLTVRLTEFQQTTAEPPWVVLADEQHIRYGSR